MSESISRRAGHRLCLHCLAVLTDDDRLHYVYTCHECVEGEHEASLLGRRDPDHPDAVWSNDPPVIIEIGRRSQNQRRLRAA